MPGWLMVQYIPQELIHPLVQVCLKFSVNKRATVNWYSNHYIPYAIKIQINRKYCLLALLGFIPRECPTNPVIEILPVKNCTNDTDCWPRICCPDGKHSYCRSTVPEWERDASGFYREFIIFHPILNFELHLMFNAFKYLSSKICEIMCDCIT
jgi:hypothetical protein